MGKSMGRSVRWGALRMGLLAGLMLALLAQLALLTAGLPAQAQEPLEEDVVWTFQGHVYEGQVGDESHPYVGAEIGVHGCNAPQCGTGNWHLGSAYTDVDGWWSVSVHDSESSYPYYIIQLYRRWTRTGKSAQPPWAARWSTRI